VSDDTMRVEAGGRSIPVELFVPASTPSAAVIVLSEIWGLNDDIRRISRRLREAGYLAAAPDLAGGRHWTCLSAAMIDVVRGRGPAVDLLVGLADALRARDDVTKVAAVGFCMGGGFALLLGCLEKIDVAGVYYGIPRPRAELERACPVVGGYGARDGVFAARGRALAADLDALGKEHDVQIVDGVGHSYMNDDRDHPILARLSWPMHVGYAHDAAEASWARMLAFFERELGSV
jgi:carboxymethylenebutenolidase